ncbi:MAG: hypothetical protein K2G37_00105, partial [Clostridia bacterium]|nr:hypothetical protein [Clostridia bacterium]
MLVLLTFATSYLLLTLVYSADCFFRNAICFIVFGCAYAVSTFLANDYFFYFFCAAATVAALPFFRISPTDFVKLALICTVAAFWLSTAEFVDGYAYSELFVASGITLAANLLFSASNRW